MSEEGYIQGAGDDSEGWSQGLTSSIFWQNKEALMAAVSNDGEEALDELVRKLVTDSKSTGRGNEVMLVKPTRNLFLAGNGMQSSYDLIIDCNGTATAIENEGDAGAARSTQVLALACKEGKSGSKTLRDKLPEVKVSVERLLKKSPDARILARCSTGNNLSPGVALVILCCLYNDEGRSAILPLLTSANMFYRWCGSSRRSFDRQTVHQTASSLDHILKARCQSISSHTSSCELVLN